MRGPGAAETLTVATFYKTLATSGRFCGFTTTPVNFCQWTGQFLSHEARLHERDDYLVA